MPLHHPIQLQERSSILDMLRGFALFGICVANYPVLSFYVFQPETVKAALPGNRFDEALQYLIEMFVEGKFYSLFSLLFGIGFSIFLLRSNVPALPGEGAGGDRGLGFFYRRLIILLVFGLLHIFLFWEGDILLLYALLGMLLPFFKNVSNRALVIWWVVLIFSPLLFDVIKVFSDGRLNIGAPVYDKAIAVGASYGINENNFYNWVPTHTEYRDILKYNHSSFYFRWGYLLNGNRLPKVLGMFLLGLYVGRKMIYAHLDENKALLTRVRNYGYLVGLPASLFFALAAHDRWNLPRPEGLFDTLFYALSVVPLSLAYTTTLCLWFMQPGKRKWLNIFIAPGRMALTNYIGQTLFAVAIFYGIGWGWGARVSLATACTIAVGVYVCLLFISHFWLKYFNYGPLEWIWRQLTYGKRLPLRKK